MASQLALDVGVASMTIAFCDRLIRSISATVELLVRHDVFTKSSEWPDCALNIVS